MSAPFLIIGLGNPGSKYSGTRHNAGFWFLDELLKREGQTLRAAARLSAEAVRARVGDTDCVLARPTEFINRSGLPVRALLDYYRCPVERLIVAYDELDLPPGTARWKAGGGHGGHNGLRDIFQHLPDRDFLRLRIGIGHPGHKDRVTGYVLGRPTAEDERLIRSSIDRALETLPLVLSGDLNGAMKALHTTPGDA